MISRDTPGLHLRTFGDILRLKQVIAPSGTETILYLLYEILIMNMQSINVQQMCFVMEKSYQKNIILI